MKKNAQAKRPTAVLVAVQLPDVSDHTVQESTAELKRLVETLGFDVVARVIQKRKSVAGATIIGEGKLLEIAKLTGGDGIVKGFSKHTSAIGVNEDVDWTEDDEPIQSDRTDLNTKASLVVFDHELTPTQAKNLEEALGVQIMDRTGVIVEIFHRHAKTPAAKAQVEIARLTYMTPRIRASTGGDRQGGGIGAKGAGETQHELDRRRIRDRIAELKQELELIHREEALRRERRRSHMKVALVGYTNAGKSSLMRSLTGSQVLVADKLFATLDTTVRSIYPETKPKILITDTVGFINKLPHDLVASFRSTLDEAMDATLLLLIADASDPSVRSQIDTTRRVLTEIDAADHDLILVLNKVDLLSELDKAMMRKEFPDAVFLSTRDESSVEGLKSICISFFERAMIDATIEIPYSSGAALAEAHKSLRVLEENHTESGITLKVRGFPQDVQRLKKSHGIK